MSIPIVILYYSQEVLDRLFGIAMDMGIIQDVSSMKNLTYAGC